MIQPLLLQRLWQRMQNWRRLEPESVHDGVASQVGMLLTDEERERFLNGFHVTLHGQASSPHEEQKGSLVPLMTTRGSLVFEQGRADLEEWMLYALAESMKTLFWAGFSDGGAFPPEIVVERLLFETQA